jgi:hypothetical protein
MTEHELGTPSTATEAALEILDSATLLMLNLAAVTRLPEASKALQSLISCRMVELLEIYIRRILELIFNHDPEAWSGRSKVKISASDVLKIPREELLRRAREEDAVRLAGKFEDTQTLLQAYLKDPPFTPERLLLFSNLKDVRNLLVHNNGLVDLAYAEKHTEVQVGDCIDASATAVLSALALLNNVQHIDDLVVTKYPELGIPVGQAMELIQMRVHQSMGLIDMTLDEQRHITAQIVELRETSPELAALLPSTVVSSLGTIWTVLSHKDFWSAVGVDQRAIVGFADEAAAYAWLSDSQLSWEGCTFADEHDETWAYGTLDNGLLFKWPQAEI